jgi:hypothetical protein
MDVLDKDTIYQVTQIVQFDLYKRLNTRICKFRD